MEAMRARRPARRTLRHGTTPRARGRAARILELQAAAGNRAVTGILVQRRGASGLLDKPLALASPTPQVIDDELVPIGEAPGRFEGFDKRDEALALAGRSKEVAVVVNDGKRYHVLRTTAATLGGTTAAPKLPKGWTVDKVVEPTNVLTDKQFRTAYDAATALSGKAQEDAFRQLLVSSTHLEYGETAWSQNEKSYTEGKVNVAVWLPANGRHLPAKVVPTGSDPLPKTAILIGKDPLTEGPASVRTTLLHEERHAYHRTQTLRLIEEWRNVRKQDTLDAWSVWLKERKKKSGAAVPTEIYWTTTAATNPNAGTSATETYSYLHGFMYRFRRDEAAAKDPRRLGDEATQQLYSRMTELNGMGKFWERSLDEDVKNDALDRLVAFAAGLTAHHLEHMRLFMTENDKGADVALDVLRQAQGAALTGRVRATTSVGERCGCRAWATSSRRARSPSPARR